MGISDVGLALNLNQKIDLKQKESIFKAQCPIPDTLRSEWV
jgi:hypothetical protein